MNISGNDTNLNIIVEAKTQYTKQLSNILKNNILEKMINEFKNTIKETKNNNEVYYNFQTRLKEIKKWNSDMIREEIDKILVTCPYINDIITAVFISNIKILTAVKLNTRKKKMDITIPSNETFVHRVYTNVAKCIYSNPYMYDINNHELVDVHIINQIIDKSIDETIVSMLPIKTILESYIKTEPDDEEKIYKHEIDNEGQSGYGGDSDDNEGDTFIKGSNDTNTIEDSKDDMSPFLDKEDEIDDELSEDIQNDNKLSTFFENPNLTDTMVKTVPIMSKSNQHEKKSDQELYENETMNKNEDDHNEKTDPSHKPCFFEDVNDD